MYMSQIIANIYHELDRFTSTNLENGDCTDFKSYFGSYTTEDITIIATGDIEIELSGESSVLGLFCSLTESFINEDIYMEIYQYYRMTKHAK